MVQLYYSLGTRALKPGTRHVTHEYKQFSIPNLCLKHAYGQEEEEDRFKGELGKLNVFIVYRPCFCAKGINNKKTG